MRQRLTIALTLALAATLAATPAALANDEGNVTIGGRGKLVAHGTGLVELDGGGQRVSQHAGRCHHRRPRGRHAIRHSRRQRHGPTARAGGALDHHHPRRLPGRHPRMGIRISPSWPKDGSAG